MSLEHSPQRTVQYGLQSGSPAPLAYSITDAVAVSAVGRTRLFRLIAEGRVKAVKSGARTLVLADSLRDYLENCPRAGSDDAS